MYTSSIPFFFSNLAKTIKRNAIVLTVLLVCVNSNTNVSIKCANMRSLLCVEDFNHDFLREYIHVTVQGESGPSFKILFRTNVCSTCVTSTMTEKCFRKS